MVFKMMINEAGAAGAVPVFFQHNYVTYLCHIYSD